MSFRGRKLRVVGAFVRAVFCTAFPIGLLWCAVSPANRSVQDVVLRTSVVYDWTPSGHVVSAAPATSIQLTLDLTEVDMGRPDGREILVEEPPGFALLMADRGQLTTHICLAGDYTPAVTYNFPFRKQA